MEAYEDENAGARTPQRHWIENQSMGGKSIEDDERAEEPALCHQKMIGPNTCRSSLLINKIREALADHRANGIDDRLTHAS